jgi:hypothetical protein
MKVMKRKIILLIICIFISGCLKTDSEKEKLVKFSNGKRATVNYEFKDVPDEKSILIVEYRNNENIIKEKTVEDEVLEIWKAMEEEADKSETEEGIIKYVYLAGKSEKTKKDVFRTLLFTTEKIENGTWKIQKVN